ncbi:hypothetical protein ACIRD3_21305 [Kitasatospora sp. NPDC093550]|uniref:hypothetical protein n=1 Tax=Kitasatospora sp. NPDC093550 TaxID=3364089 RepID=UPI0038161EE9
MAQTFPGRQAPARRTAAGARHWPWLVLALVEFLAAAPMLGRFALAGLVTGVMGLAAGATPGSALLLVLMLAAGPVLGMAAAAVLVALFAPALGRIDKSVVVALLMAGLLLGTSIEYFGWLRPVIG